MVSTTTTVWLRRERVACLAGKSSTRRDSSSKLQPTSCMNGRGRCSQAAAIQLQRILAQHALDCCSMACGGGQCCRPEDKVQVQRGGYWPRFSAQSRASGYSRFHVSTEQQTLVSAYRASKAATSEPDFPASRCGPCCRSWHRPHIKRAPPILGAYPVVGACPAGTARGSSVTLGFAGSNASAFRSDFH